MTAPNPYRTAALLTAATVVLVLAGCDRKPEKAPAAPAPAAPASSDAAAPAAAPPPGEGEAEGHGPGHPEGSRMEREAPGPR